MIKSAIAYFGRKRCSPHKLPNYRMILWYNQTCVIGFSVETHKTGSNKTVSHLEQVIHIRQADAFFHKSYNTFNIV